jgi:hypothetical protein
VFIQEGRFWHFLFHDVLIVRKVGFVNLHVHPFAERQEIRASAISAVAAKTKRHFSLLQKPKICILPRRWRNTTKRRPRSQGAARQGEKLRWPRTGWKSLREEPAGGRRG